MCSLGAFVHMRMREGCRSISLHLHQRASKQKRLLCICALAKIGVVLSATDSNAALLLKGTAVHPSSPLTLTFSPYPSFPPSWSFWFFSFPFQLSWLALVSDLVIVS